VKAGEVLFVLEDDFLPTRLRILEARLREVRLERRRLQSIGERVQVEILEDEIALIGQDLALTRSRAEALTVRSPGNGVFLVEHPENLPGRFVRKGELLGYVADPLRPTVRVAVSQADIGLVRAKSLSASVRLAARPGDPVAAEIERQVPAAVERLPSAALGPLGGGPFAVHSDDATGTRPMESIFELELRVPLARDWLGERAYVLFDHGREPLAWQWYRRLRQLFLKRFAA
jgi:putative peptide zinc metalloprotease protein